VLVHCGVGSWELRVPAEHPMAAALRVRGSGIIVRDGVETVFSGRMRRAVKVQDAGDPVGTWLFTGVDDQAVLWASLAFPDPAHAVGAQGYAYDFRVGDAESVIKAFVDANIGGSATLARGYSWLSTGPDLGRGATVSGSARFDVLGELCASLATLGGVGFRSVQVGAGVVVECYEPADKRKMIRLSVENDTLTSTEWGHEAPTVTRAVIAGQGEGVDRTFIERTSSIAEDSEDQWGMRFETFKDQRNTNDVGELEQAGDELLLDGAGTATTVQFTAADFGNMRFRRDWFLGDLVTVVVDGVEASAVIAQVAVSVSSAGVIVQASLGDPSGFSFEARVVRELNKTKARVALLERSAEVARPMRLSFATVTELNAFTGWPGLIGFVEADFSEHMWRSGWKLWSIPRTAYTASFQTGVVIGNGTMVCHYSVSAGLVVDEIRFIVGSTTVISTEILIQDIPILGVGVGVGGVPVTGEVLMRDVSLSAVAGAFRGRALAITPTPGGDAFRVIADNSAGTYTTGAFTSATVPFTWATGDTLNIRLTRLVV